MHLFLAPHFDDVALSCGGEVARVVSRGETATIATIFGGAPPLAMPLTPYARGHLVQWGVASLEEAFRARRAEDEAAARALGATPHILPFVDGVFREDHYRSWDELRGQPVPAEADLSAQIVDMLVGSGLIGPDTTITGPLAIGRHVDHQLVYAAMRLLAARGIPVRGYEDFPYATQEDEYQARMRALRSPGRAHEMIDITPWLETKIRAIACYPSQLPSLFRGVPMPDAVRVYGTHVAGGRGVAERFWLPGVE